MPALALAPVVRSHVGRVRRENEDAVFASVRLLAVADGVGGHAAGEVASGVVVNALVALDKRRSEGPVEDELVGAITEGNDAVAFVAQTRPECAGMASTLTALAVDDDRYVVANLGDSRTYLLRDGELRRLTRDDSLVQELIDGGTLTPEAARYHPQRSVVSAVIDGVPGRTPTITSVPGLAGDRLLLCSDGLSDLVEDDEIRRALEGTSCDESADRLLALALDAGGRDNISLVVADAV